ncbi:multicopy suppressor of BFA (Brefeldin A) [Coemansia biformis]|uniref:Multicopy suppressor of BFA (Brefeldin A) n=1 Tax=Coemansia biformis TaxID=1286918 RepID=A0A9W8CZU6_9FUNG|nr:multicopy suppressor of BFA (Brefeldin A) [Coemansia biformis]
MAPESTAPTADRQRMEPAARNERPTRPDAEAHKQQLAAIDGEIDRLRKEQDAIRDALDRTDPRKGPTAETRGRLASRLQEIRTEQGGLRKSRGKVFDRQAALAASIGKKTAELKAQQAKLTYKTVAEIDDMIATKDRQIESGSLKLVDERRLTGEVSSLRRARKHVEQAEALQKAIDGELAELAEIDEQLADTNAQALSEEHGRLQHELDGLKASQEGGHQKRSELLAERTRVAKALDHSWEKKRALQNEHRQESNVFYQWQQEERKRKAAEDKQRRIHEQREKRLALAQEQREEAEAPAFQTEIGSCDTLIAYLNGLRPTAAAAAAAVNGGRSEASSRPSSAASTARDAGASDHVPAGMVAVKRTNCEEAYFAGTGGKARRRLPRKEKAAGAKADALKLPLAVAERFLELQVDIPTTTSGIAAAVDKLVARKRHFVELQPQATEDNMRMAEARIAKLMAELEVDEKIVA